MVNNHYRWDFIGLSTDEKPTPETSEKVVNGSTFYTSDDSKLYVWCDGEWYEKIVSGGGGGGSDINVVQTTGQSTNDVMSQKAVTDALNAVPTGGVTELTADDYNYHSSGDTDNGVATWLLEPGLYYAKYGVRVYVTNNASSQNGMSLYVASKTSTNTEVFRSVLGQNNWAKDVFYNPTGQRTSATTFLDTAGLLQSTGPSTVNAMSQKAVTDAIAAIPTGDAFTELTSVDYNYPADNPDGIAVWLLPLGLYKFADGVKVYFVSNVSYIATTANPQYLGVMSDNVYNVTGRKFIIEFAWTSGGTHPRNTMRIYHVNNNGVSTNYDSMSYVLTSSDIYNNLDQSRAGWALDAAQGKILNDKITALEDRVAALEGN